MQLDKTIKNHVEAIYSIETAFLELFYFASWAGIVCYKIGIYNKFKDNICVEIGTATSIHDTLASINFITVFIPTFFNI